MYPCVWFNFVRWVFSSFALPLWSFRSESEHSAFFGERRPGTGAHLNELQSINEHQIKICFYCASIHTRIACGSLTTSLKKYEIFTNKTTERRERESVRESPYKWILPLTDYYFYRSCFLLLLLRYVRSLHNVKWRFVVFVLFLSRTIICHFAACVYVCAGALTNQSGRNENGFQAMRKDQKKFQT